MDAPLSVLCTNNPITLWDDNNLTNIWRRVRLISLMIASALSVCLCLLPGHINSTSISRSPSSSHRRPTSQGISFRWIQSGNYALSKLFSSQSLCPESILLSPQMAECRICIVLIPSHHPMLLLAAHAGGCGIIVAPLRQLILLCQCMFSLQLQQQKKKK